MLCDAQLTRKLGALRQRKRRLFCRRLRLDAARQQQRGALPAPESPQPRWL
jgi:hypothetical protein